jgi:hypothetical protein
MKIRAICYACCTANAPQGPCDAALHDDGLVIVTCALGHRELRVLTAPRYELLVEFGAVAFHDREYRDAVATLTAALDAFCEFYVRVLASPLGDDPTAASTLPRASVPQLDAFLAAHLVETGEPAPHPHLLPTYAQLADDVTGAAYVPTRAETLAYGGAVVEFIRGVGGRLVQTRWQSVCAVVRREGVGVFERAEASGIVNVAPEENSFSDALSWVLLGSPRSLPRTFEHLVGRVVASVRGRETDRAGVDPCAGLPA